MSWVADRGGGGDDWSNATATTGTRNDTQTGGFGQNDSANSFGNFGSGGFKEDNANFVPDEPKSGCFNCGEEGHTKADCPHPRKFSGACRNCNEEGHMSKDCPSRRQMVCKACNEEGHMAKECPTRGPLICSNCNQEGHSRAKCENARVIDRNNIPDVSPDDAWNELMDTIKAQDLDDAKVAIEKYSKACPEMTFFQLQEGIFDLGLEFYLIAKERTLLPTYTNMDLQGNLNKKYSISYRFSDKPQRPKEAEGWPTTREEILSRLGDAGIVVEQSVPYCSKCNEMGHIRKHCRQEDTGEIDRPIIMCHNCNDAGHRVRDCPQPRSTKGACRNCGKPGHKANECEEPRSAANIDCRKCGKMGHFSRDCPQGGGGGEKRSCHIYGSENHLARECPEKGSKGSKNFYTKRSDVGDAEPSQGENQLGSSGDGAFNQGGSTGDGDWETSGSAGGGW